MPKPFDRIAVALGLDPKELNEGLKKAEDSVKSFGKKLTIGVSTPVAAALGFSAKAAIDFEKAFIGVRKTVDGTSEELESLRMGIRGLAKEMPATVVEIAQVAEAAGQLGVQTKNVLEFTETMIKVGETTNIAAEDAARGFAQLANVTGLPQEKIGDLASVLSKLGNTLSTDEQRILDMSKRLAGAGTTVGLTSEEVVGLAGAVASLGVEAEAGGTNVSKILITMAKAVDKGGNELELFARVAGKTVQEFAEVFEDDAADALIAFTQGLGELESQGVSAFQVIETLGLDGARATDVLLRMGNAGNDVADSLNAARKEMIEVNSLTQEYEQFAGSTSAQLVVMRNEINDVAIQIGEAMLPTIREFASEIGDLLTSFAAWAKGKEEAIVKIGLLVAAVGPAIVVVGQLMTAIRGLSVAAKFFIANPIVATLAAITAGSYAAAEAISRFGKEVESAGKKSRQLFPPKILEGAGPRRAPRRDPRVPPLGQPGFDRLQDQGFSSEISRFRSAGGPGVPAGDMGPVGGGGGTIPGLGGFIVNGINAAGQAIETVGQQARTFFDDIEKRNEEVSNGLIDNWHEFGKQFEVTTHKLFEAFTGFVDSSVGTFADGVATMLVDGGSFSDIMQEVWKQIARTAISAIIQIGAQWLISLIVGKGITAADTSSKMAGHAMTTYGGAFSATAAIPIIGPFIAPGVASAAVATMLAGAAGSAAMGAGVGLATGGLAEGGLITGPMIALMGEAGDEVVVPLDRLGEFGGGEMVVNLHIDSELVAKSTVPHIGDVVDLNIGRPF